MLEKSLKIKGMSCSHCATRVEKALNSLDGVEAKVDLASNSAKLTLAKELSNEEIKKAVENVGYEVIEISE
jgi:copper chaperone CopZ